MSRSRTLVIGTALEVERAPILKRLRRSLPGSTLRPDEAWPGCVALTWRGYTVLLATVGLRAARLAPVAAYLDRHGAAVAVLLGLGGGLDAAWRPGELAVARAVSEHDEGCGNDAGAARAWVASERMVAWGESARLRAGLAGGTAGLLSAKRVVALPAAKAALGRESGCGVVEMESARFAAAAEAAAVEWLCARVVLDHAGQRLPPLEGLAEVRGLARLRRVAGLALTRPLDMLALPALGWRAAACGRALGAFAHALLETWIQATHEEDTPPPGAQ